MAKACAYLCRFSVVSLTASVNSVNYRFQIEIIRFKICPSQLGGENAGNGFAGV